MINVTFRMKIEGARARDLFPAGSLFECSVVNSDKEYLTATLVDPDSYGSHRTDLAELRKVQQLNAKIDTLQLVGDFHRAFDFPPEPLRPLVQDWDSFCAHELEVCAVLLAAIERRLKVASSVYLTPPQCLLHPQLMVSELSELLRAMAARDMVACLDAVGDLRYVNDGAVRSLGLASVFYNAFGLIHVSNMSKLDENGNVVKDKTGKVLKGDWYTPVRLEHLIP